MGQWADKEKDFEDLKENGAKIVTLGKRILRSETASMYALSVIANYLEGK